MTTATIVNESTQQIINTNLQDALSLVIGKTMQGVDASVDFLQQEIPDVIYQLILWYGVKSAVTALFAIIGIILLVVSGKKLVSYIAKNYKEWGDEAVAIGGMFIGIPSVCTYLFALYRVWEVCYTNLMTALQIWIAPKIFLLDYASSFIK